jgi:chitodextrinase
MQKMKKTLKELQAMRVIIDKDIKETEELKQHLSDRVYKSNMNYLLAMRDKNDIYQAEARLHELKEMQQ